MEVRRILVVLVFVFSCQVAQAQHKYYVSSSSGKDTYSTTQAQSKSTPWAHVPGMHCATNTAASYTPVAGDSFILKGGDKWSSSCFPLSVTHSGSSSAVIYYGVDQTWYVGLKWVRPLFDLGYSPVSFVVNATNQKYITIDNIEMAHQTIVPSTTYSTVGCGIMFQPTHGWGNYMAGTTVENVYIHDWQLGTSSTSWSASARNNFWCIGGIQGAQTVTNSTLSDVNGFTYINGTKQSGCTGANSDGCAGNGVAIANVVSGTKIAGGWQGTSNVVDQHDNDYYNIWQNESANLASIHAQIIEDTDTCAGSGGVTGHSSLVYNNLLHDSNAGVNIFVRYFSTIYNNVGWNTASVTQGNGSGNAPIRLCVPNGDSAGNVGFVHHNSWDTTSKLEALISPVFYSGSRALGKLYISNNLNVGVAGIGGVPNSCSSCTTRNYAMSSSEASAYGFITSLFLAPTSSYPADSNVKNAGVNLTSSCSGSLAKLCSDTEGAFWLGGTTQSRPSSGAWTIGAYVLPTGPR